MIRFRLEKVPHRRPLKLALTCGEETNGAFNGAEYLSKSQRPLIDAEFRGAVALGRHVDPIDVLADDLPPLVRRHAEQVAAVGQANGVPAPARGGGGRGAAGAPAERTPPAQ